MIGGGWPRRASRSGRHPCQAATSCEMPLRSATRCTRGRAPYCPPSASDSIRMGAVPCRRMMRRSWPGWREGFRLYHLLSCQETENSDHSEWRRSGNSCCRRVSMNGSSFQCRRKCVPASPAKSRCRPRIPSAQRVPRAEHCALDRASRMTPLPIHDDRSCQMTPHWTPGIPKKCGKFPTRVTQFPKRSSNWTPVALAGPLTDLVNSRKAMSAAQLRLSRLARWNQCTYVTQCGWLDGRGTTVSRKVRTPRSDGAG